MRKKYIIKVISLYFLGLYFLIGGYIQYFDHIKVFRRFTEESAYNKMVGGSFLLIYSIYATIMLIIKGKDWPPPSIDEHILYRNRIIQAICWVVFISMLAFLILYMLDILKSHLLHKVWFAAFIMMIICLPYKVRKAMENEW